MHTNVFSTRVAWLTSLMFLQQATGNSSCQLERTMWWRERQVLRNVLCITCPTGCRIFHLSNPDLLFFSDECKRYFFPLSTCVLLDWLYKKENIDRGNFHGGIAFTTTPSVTGSKIAFKNLLSVLNSPSHNVGFFLLQSTTVEYQACRSDNCPTNGSNPERFEFCYEQYGPSLSGHTI